MPKHKKRPKFELSGLEKSAMKATRWVGSTGSLVVHTLFFVFMFILYLFGVNIDFILLLLTTLVSLEAIYLAIFIQMSVNRQSERLQEVSEDLEEIEEDLEDLEEEDRRDEVIYKRIENNLGRVIEELLELKKNKK
jgi:uncharacterized membrane protein